MSTPPTAVDRDESQSQTDAHRTREQPTLKTGDEISSRDIDPDSEAPETTEARCPECSNYLTICGHNLPYAERIRHVRIDTAWMPNRPKGRR